MIVRKFVESKKKEYEIAEFILKSFNKGIVSTIKVERTPIGEKITIWTSRPGLVIGKLGSRLQELTDFLKTRFKLENPQIEVLELVNPEFDAQVVADRIVLALERHGPLRFKLIAYRELENFVKAKALGAEIRLSGRLPSERAKSWRFAFGYLIKTGADLSIVNKAQSTAITRPGMVGVKVMVVPKDARIPDKIEINRDEVMQRLKQRIAEETGEAEKEEKKIRVKKTKKAESEKKANKKRKKEKQEQEDQK